MGQIISKFQAPQLGPDELAGGQPTALFVGQLPQPAHQLEGDHLRVSLLIDDALGQDVPDHDEEFPGDGGNGLARFHAAGQTLKLAFPVSAFLDGDPSGFDHDPAEVAPALLGDASRRRKQ